MNKYLLLFRMDILTKEAQPTQKQMELYMDQWMRWINEIADKGQLADGGNHLSKKGRVLRPDNAVSDQPYVVNKESIAGYIIVLAKNLEDSVSIAKKCPILNGKGTSVEVRERIKE